MKKINSLSFISSLLFAFGLLSCNKESNEQLAQPPAVTAPDSVLIKKINAWMDMETQTHEEPERKETIQTVKQNLDFSRMQVEEYKEGMKFIFVPLRSNFVSNTHKEIRPENTVLFRTNAAGEIEKGNIVQYIPENTSAGTKLPSGLIKKVFLYEPVQGTFRLSFTSVADFLLYEIKIKDGKPASMGITDQRTKAAATGQGKGEQVEQCYDVYWVEFYPDGSTVWSYMYSYCNDACNTTRPVAGRGTIIACGGNSGEAVEYELKMSKDIDWLLYSPNGTSGGIISVERLKGRKLSSNPQGGEFKSTSSHFWSICNICNSDAGDVWFENSNSLVASGQTASSSVTGDLRFEGQLTTGISGNKSWTFHEIFP